MPPDYRNGKLLRCQRLRGYSLHLFGTDRADVRHTLRERLDAVKEFFDPNDAGEREHCLEVAGQ